MADGSGSSQANVVWHVESEDGAGRPEGGWSSGPTSARFILVVLAFAALSVAVLFVCECCARRHDEKPPTHRRVRMSSSSSGSSLPSPGVQPAGHGVGIALDGPGGSPMTLHSEQPNPAAVERRSPRRPPPRQGTPPRRQPKRP